MYHGWNVDDVCRCVDICIGVFTVIEIFNLHKEKSSLPYEFIVDRTTVLGNPYYMDKEHSRDEVCDFYDDYLRDKIAEKDPAIINELNRLYSVYVRYGKLRLFCWCAPERCHAETIKRVLLDKFQEREGRKHWLKK